MRTTSETGSSNARRWIVNHYSRTDCRAADVWAVGGIAFMPPDSTGGFPRGRETSGCRYGGVGAPRPTLLFCNEA
jgi:hypothetical protein